MDESYNSEPPAIPAPEAPPSRESNMVSDSWQQTVQAVLGVVLLLGAFAMVHYYSPQSRAGRAAHRPPKAGPPAHGADRTAPARSGHARGRDEPISQFHRLHLRRISSGIRESSPGSPRPRFRHRIPGGQRPDRHQPSRRRTLVSEIPKPRSSSIREPPRCSKTWSFSFLARPRP